MQSVFYYEDYREFLSDYYKFKKRQNPNYSYRLFSIAARLGSPNYLKLVIGGKKNLTVSNIHSFARAMGLERGETVYFEALVLYNQAKQDDESKFYKRRLKELKTIRPQKQKKAEKTHPLFANYLLPACLFHLLTIQPGDEQEVLSARLGLPKNKIKELLEPLFNNMLVQAKEDQFVVDFDHIVFHQPGPLEVQKKYLLSHLDLSQRAFTKAYPNHGKFFAHTFTVPEDGLHLCASRIRTFIDQLTAESDSGPQKDVMQINVQLFPLDRRVLT